MFSILLTAIVAFLTFFIPGELLSLALLRKTKLHFFEISVIGFILGMIAPPTLTWMESYAISYVHAFSFSLGLFEANAVVLSIIGLVLCFQQGVFSFSGGISRKGFNKAEKERIASDQAELRQGIHETRDRLRAFESAKSVVDSHMKQEEEIKRKQEKEIELATKLTDAEKDALRSAHTKELERITKDHEQEESMLLSRLERDSTYTPKQTGKRFSIRENWHWIVLLLIMLVGFSTMILSIAVAPNYFEFDPYFDMLATKSILVFGQQFYKSTSAWPVVSGGTVMRIQPLIPYIEAYWYSLAGFFGASTASFNTALMSYVSGVYPPITGALLAFSVFMLLYYDYDKKIALIGAALTVMLPVIIITFISGEQLLEPWGIFSLFFFFATYLLAVKNMDEPRYAILAGIAFASTFLGAHYYTVDAGVLALYIIVQGVISVLRGENNKNFYKMNIIVLFIIALFLIPYHLYHATLSGRIPSILGIPITISFGMAALLFVAVFDYLPKMLASRKILINKNDVIEKVGFLAFLIIIMLILIFATPIGNSVKSYLALSKKFTTPSSPLFMTVQEYAPTGLGYNFFAGGFGLLAANTFGLPILIWVIIALAMIMILVSIVFRNSKTGILYLAISLPLTVAAISEVKYLPHFAIAYIILFCILLGETVYIINNGLYWRKGSPKISKDHESLVLTLLSIGIFFISPILALVYLIYIIYWRKIEYKKFAWALFAIMLLLMIGTLVFTHTIMLGEIKSTIGSYTAMFTYSANPSNACTVFGNNGNGMGSSLYCNTIPSYWIAATEWMSKNVGPYAPRILAWWDYGDWINWFGNSNAVLRGDNSVPKEDYATAASYVLGQKEGYGPTELANTMNGNQTEYVLFDNQLVPKWGALDFLACVDVNATSEQYAISAAKQQNVSAPYLLGTSQCEVQHDPVYTLVPLATLTQNSSQSTLSDYCSLNTSTPYIRTLNVIGYTLSNQTFCMDPVPTKNGALQLYYSNGTKANAVIQESYNNGLISVGGANYLEFMVIYLPNGPNDTVVNAPSEFYSSNYYRGFFLGKLPGFTQVYPNVTNATGVNLVNYTQDIRIYKLDNYTGGNPTVVPQKPSYISNNLSMP